MWVTQIQVGPLNFGPPITIADADISASDCEDNTLRIVRNVWPQSEAYVLQPSSFKFSAISSVVIKRFADQLLDLNKKQGFYSDILMYGWAVDACRLSLDLICRTEIIIAINQYLPKEIPAEEIGMKITLHTQIHLCFRLFIEVVIWRRLVGMLLL